MQFATAHTQKDLVTDICAYFQDHLQASLGNAGKDKAEEIENKFEDFLDSLEVEEILDYLLELKDLLVQLPTLHSKAQITIQRVYLLILPLLKILEKEGKNDKLRSYLEQLMNMITKSSYSLSVKINV